MINGPPRNLDTLFTDYGYDNLRVPKNPLNPFYGELTWNPLGAKEQQWTFAKTMPEWPHEYIVRERDDEQLFEDLVRHIRSHGRDGRFYAKVLIYYEEVGMVYWTMGAPLAETTIVNRCRSDDTYERRLAAGNLP